MSALPSYLAAARPVPLENRAPWYKTIAPTYAGIMLWFVFWQDLSNAAGTVKGLAPPGGTLSLAIFPAFIGLAIGIIICHFLFYMTPGLLGAKTGYPLYVVGTSTYGARGGLIMPGFVMGILQFGWLAVNAFFVSKIFCMCFGIGLAPTVTGGMEPQVPGWTHGTIATIFAVAAAIIGLKGIKYVARVATYLPIIPVVVIVMLIAMTYPGLRNFDLAKIVLFNHAQLEEMGFDIRDVADPEIVEMAEARFNEMKTFTVYDLEEMGFTPEDYQRAFVKAPWMRPLGQWGVIAAVITYVVGFFATAGAAGADIAANSRNEADVHVGGLAGVVIPTVIAGEAVLLAVMGAYGIDNMIRPENLGKLNPVDLMPDILGSKVANIAMIGLAISSFPGACFSAFIAANSFKTTMPKIHPFISVGIGTLVTVWLAVSGIAGDVVGVFQVIGASFGPVCGAMLADYWLSGLKWSGPRAGFNPAGWISWIVGFAVGAFNLVVKTAIDQHWQWAYDKFPNIEQWWNFVPIPPVSAFVVGFALYMALSILGLRTRKLEMPSAEPVCRLCARGD